MQVHGAGAEASVSGPQPLTHIPLSPHFFPLLSKGREKTKGGRDGEHK